MTLKLNGTSGIEYPDNSIRGSGSLIASMFKNLSLSATGLSALTTIMADAIVLEDADFSPIIARGVNLTPSLAVSGVNGLDAGVSAASTWYSVWVISNGLTVAGLLSTSATNPTMPSGYTYKARVGWVRSDSTGNKYPLSFKQFGRSVQYVVAGGSNVTRLPLMASGVNGSVSTPTWVSVAASNFVPPTADAIDITIGEPSATSTVVMVAPNNAYGAYNSITNPPPFGISGLAALVLSPTKYSMILESPNIYWAASNANAFLTANGWTDNL